MTTGREAWNKKKENRLLIAVENFMGEHNITSNEVIEDGIIGIKEAYQFIQDLCEITGYTKSEDEL